MVKMFSGQELNCLRKHLRGQNVQRVLYGRTGLSEETSER
jgi:hypothetical protein